jgi:hypothetical protein
VHTLVLSLEASQAAAAAAAASGVALQRLLDGVDAGVTRVRTAAVAVPPPPPPQTLECASLPQMDDVKYSIDLSPFAARDSDGDSARRRLVRVRLGCTRNLQGTLQG